MELTKDQFDKLYVGKNLAVHCDTEYKANEFLKMADRFGYMWCNGHSYRDTKWDIKQENACYNLMKGEYSEKTWYESENYTIVTYPQHPKQFTKSNLKSGDKVVYRSGQELFVLTETRSLHNPENGYQYGYLSEYDEFLKCIHDTDFDIMKVYRNNILIWERIEEPQKTTEQLEIERIEKEMRKLADELSSLKNK